MITVKLSRGTGNICPAHHGPIELQDSRIEIDEYFKYRSLNRL